MQTLELRNTYTPTNAPQVRGNCGLSLNREETLSVPGLKTSSNSSEVDKRHKARQDLRVPVYVLNMRGQPLMPTTPRKARMLLKQGKAKVVQRTPFIIQLKYATGESKQPIKLGIDPNYTKIGYSAVTDRNELISGEVKLRDDISEKLTERKQYRRNRRNKLRYRQPRFNNRRRTETLSPSRGGSDRISNLTISCHKCNQKKGNKTAQEFDHPEIQEQAKQSLKSAAFMNAIRWQLVNMLNSDHTYGYITKHNRIRLNLEKSHINDAFVIAGGTDQIRIKPHTIKQNRRNNRALQINRKGFKPSIRRKRYEIQPNDLVRYGGFCFYVKGICNYGRYVSLKDSGGKMIYPNIKNVELVQYGKGLQFICTALLSHLKVGVPEPERV